MAQADTAEADRGCGAAERPGDRRPRLIAYFDTSGFVKLLVPEPGAAEVATAWLEADRRVSSLLLYPEARAAVGRARRLARIAPRQLGIARRRLERFWAAIDRVELTEALARRAGDLAEGHGLRACDAVHLASFEQVDDPETVLVSADSELLDAARALGFTTAPLP